MPYLALISGGGEFQFFDSYTSRTKQHSHGRRSITASMVAICDWGSRAGFFANPNSEDRHKFITGKTGDSRDGYLYFTDMLP